MTENNTPKEKKKIKVKDPFIDRHLDFNNQPIEPNNFYHSVCTGSFCYISKDKQNLMVEFTEEGERKKYELDSKDATSSGYFSDTLSKRDDAKKELKNLEATVELIKSKLEQSSPKFISQKEFIAAVGKDSLEIAKSDLLGPFYPDNGIIDYD